MNKTLKAGLFIAALAMGIGLSSMSSFGTMEIAKKEKSACTTCHVILREGFDSLDEAEEKEEDMLDKAWGLEANSRLSCQARVRGADLVVEIPKYTINYAREEH